MKKLMFISLAACLLLLAFSHTAMAQRRGGYGSYSASYAPPADSSKHRFKQTGIGLEGGYNYSNVTGAASIHSSARTGFMAGIAYMPGGFSKHLFGYRTELIFSRQGYDFLPTPLPAM